MSNLSPTSPDLFLLENNQDFHEFTLKLLANTNRYLAILSRDLDPLIYNSDEVTDAISTLARSSTQAHIQILVKDTSNLIKHDHKLVRLSQRLSSKIFIRKLIVETDDKNMDFMLCDTDGLLFKNDDAVYQGFANMKAAPEVKHFRETFNYLWNYAETDPDLQQLCI